MKTQFQFISGKKRGFSMIEILVTISVIGVISSISIPMMSHLSDQAARNQARRNAQSIAAAVSEAVGFGNTTILSAGSKDAAVSLVLTGLSVNSDVNVSSVRISLSEEDAEMAKPYLTYENQILLYKP